MEMIDPAAASEGNGRSWHERKLDRTILRTYRATLDIDEVLPNESQPRMGPKEDEELQRQIEANDGLFEPLLLEPHPDLPGKFRIIDGDRRWTNCRVLIERGRGQYRQLPAEVTDRTLSDDERLRVWIYIHRQRKEWDAKEKEMVAYRLVKMVGRASSANILGITVRELDKLVEIFELSEQIKNHLHDPAASITWAREIKNLNKKLVTPPVLNVIVRKIKDREITSSKEVRKLRAILRDPVAKDEFLNDGGTIEAAAEKVASSPPRHGRGLREDIDSLVESVKRYPWTTLESLRGDREVLKGIEDAERVLKDLKQLLSR